MRWLVDPLDGTVNFLYGLPVFAVSIAAEVDGDGRGRGGRPSRPRARPSPPSGAGGRGSTGGRCAARTVTELSEALVGTGFSYRPERRLLQAGLLATVLPAVRDIRRAGAAAVDLCWVGAGRLDAFYEHGLQPWDLAAGALVAAEAGAVVGDLDGGPPRPSSRWQPRRGRPGVLGPAPPGRPVRQTGETVPTCTAH